MSSLQLDLQRLDKSNVIDCQRFEKMPKIHTGTLISK